MWNSKDVILLIDEFLFHHIVNYLQTINFFNLGTKLSLVDLPGYGFAYAKDEVKEAWEDLVSMHCIKFSMVTGHIGFILCLFVNMSRQLS
jgi:hypothetical protein